MTKTIEMLICLIHGYGWFFAHDSEVCDCITICKRDFPLILKWLKLILWNKRTPLII